jgi:hypothetical protein
MEYALARLKEPSTWRGLALFAGGFGVQVAPDLIPAIGAAVAAVIGLVEVLRKEK